MRQGPAEYRVWENSAGDVAAIYLYDVIGSDPWGGGGVSARQFSADLGAIKAKTIHLHLNSPGGDVFDGRAMAAALHAHPAKKIVHVDGLAASAASFLAMHADEIVMNEGSMLMIHNGWTFAIGDKNEMRETADLLDKIDGAIVDDYMRRTNASREQVVAWMNDETWFTAKESVEHGFADRIEGGKDDKSKAKNVVQVVVNVVPPEPEPEPEPQPEATPEPVADDPRWTHNARRLAAL